MIDRGDWASGFAECASERLIAFTSTNQLALAGWAGGEFSPDIALEGPRNNPLCCTLRVPGSTDFNDLGNGEGVQNYETVEIGWHATLAVLLQPTEGGFAPIRLWLANGGCMCETFYAVASSKWGTFSGRSQSSLDSYVDQILRVPKLFLGAPVPGS
jgi:hypothetical protein